ncbi:MAG TPA: hypothetical protein VGF67_21485 [Ktedonobacteraceae bacterium]|jgi:GTPase Era involved in 16S rRNA processing
MIGTRQERISEIIQTRTPFLQAVLVIQGELQQYINILRDLENLRSRLIKQGSPEMAKSLDDLQFASLGQEIAETLRDLEKPKSRFARRTLNIGVIGRARQGKSRLLQSLSGLTSQVIPTGSAGHCTGTRSLICHSSGRQEAEIFFYDERSFLTDVLAPYYEKLGLGAPPSSLSQFGSTPLPPLTASEIQIRHHARSGAMYQHLQNYKKNFPLYSQFINKQPLRIPLQQVREYVAQESADGQQTFANYLAVQEARIYCDFGHKDVGQIALVDMPGLGDTGAGAEERLVAALGEALDVVLFVMMPQPGGAVLSEVDFDLYDLAFHALDGIPIDRWSFMVLNRTTPARQEQAEQQEQGQQSSATGPLMGNNHRNCERISELIRSGRAGSAGRNIRVVNCFIADCSKANDAKELVLEETLQYLVQEIAHLDTMYMSAWQKRLQDLRNRVRSEIEKALQRLSAQQERSQNEKRFDDLFTKLWEELLKAADELVLALENQSSQPNEKFLGYFRGVFEQCRRDTNLPSKDVLIKMRHRTNALINARNEALDYMRTHLTYHFIGMDKELQVTMDDVKLNVVQLFLEKGKLADLWAGAPPQRFFELAAGELRTLSPGLYRALAIFDSYELSLRGFFQSRIRQNLTRMIPDRADPLPLDRLTPEYVLEQLRTIQEQTVNEVESSLMRFVNEPGQAAFAVVQEFIDQVLRSKEARGTWRSFYSAHREKVWISEFEQSVKREEMQRAWQDLTGRAYNTVLSMQAAGAQSV